MIAAMAAGVVLGVIYTLSPLTAICVPMVIAVCAWVARDLSTDERRWFVVVLSVAVLARLLATSVLFVSADPARPFDVLFGDELFFKNRSLWMRNLGLGVPMSPADVIYAVEDVGETSYLYALALIQAMVGKTPYGIHVLNSTCYVIATVLMFRMVRQVFGAVAAFAGMTILLFMPSQFMWSISALKEPAYVLAAAAELLCAVYAARATEWRHRAMWIAGVVAAAIALESLRRGGSIVAIAGAGIGYFAGYVLPRPRLLLAAVAVVPALILAGLLLPPIQERALNAMRTGAYYHSGHVNTPGYSYHALSGEYYVYGRRIADMPAREGVEFVARSFVAYVTEPVPWRIESKALLAYLPEQALWYVLLALGIAGVIGGMRIDPMMTMLLAAHAGVAATIVAISGGNIGTLIRHRGLIMPYLAWLAGLGLYHVVSAALRPSSAVYAGGLHAHDHL